MNELFTKDDLIMIHNPNSLDPKLLSYFDHVVNVHACIFNFCSHLLHRGFTKKQVTKV